MIPVRRLNTEQNKEDTTTMIRAKSFKNNNGKFVIFVYFARSNKFVGALKGSEPTKREGFLSEHNKFPHLILFLLSHDLVRKSPQNSDLSLPHLPRLIARSAFTPMLVLTPSAARPRLCARTLSSIPLTLPACPCHRFSTFAPLFSCLPPVIILYQHMISSVNKKVSKTGVIFIWA